jgi:hypothetical protein
MNTLQIDEYGMHNNQILKRFTYDVVYCFYFSVVLCYE